MKNKFFIIMLAHAGKIPIIKKNRSAAAYYLYFILVMAFAAWLFWHGINGDFLFDDWQVLLQTDFVRDHSAWFYGYRPLRNLSYVIDLQFGDLKPFTFHLSNLVYHLINILLVFNVLNLLIRPVLTVEKIWIAGIVTVFAIHPVQVESVVYISGRRDLLFSLFYLSGIIIFLKFLNNPHAQAGTKKDESRDITRHMKAFHVKNKKRSAWTWVLIFTLFSTASKEAGITLPVFCLILQQYFYGQWIKISLKHVILFFLFLTCLLFYSISMALPSLSAGYMGGSFFTHIENCSYFLFKYIIIALSPVNLAADYSDFSLGFIENPVSLKGISSLFGAGFITVFSLARLFVINKTNTNKTNKNKTNKNKTSTNKFQNSSNTCRPAIEPFSLFAFGWLWFVITILPMSNIVPHVERFALHYLYLPLIGIFIAVWGLWSVVVNAVTRGVKIYMKACLNDSNHRLSNFVMADENNHAPVMPVKWMNLSVISSWSVAVNAVMRGWKSGVGLWLPNLMTGVVLVVFALSLSIKTRHEIKWWQDDVIFWDHNSRVNPRCARAHANLGTALIRAEQFKKAEAALTEALAIKDLPQAFLGMATIAMDERKYNKAGEFLCHVPKNRIRFEKQRLFLLGMVAFGKGDIANARLYSDKLCRQWPGFDGGYFLMGKIEMEQAEYVKACSSFKQAVDVCPFIQRNHVELIRAFVINKQPGSAMESLEQGFKNRLWKENDPDRLNDLGYVAELMGLDEKAVESYQYAVDSDPGCIMAALNLSRILYQEQKFDQVVKLAQKVVIPDVDNVDGIEASLFMNNVGLANIMLGRRDKGKKALQKALNLWQDNKSARRNLNLIMGDNG